MPHGSARPGDKANDLFSLSHEVNAYIDLEFWLMRTNWQFWMTFRHFLVRGWRLVRQLRSTRIRGFRTVV